MNCMNYEEQYLAACDRIQELTEELRNVKHENELLKKREKKAKADLSKIKALLKNKNEAAV